MLSITFRNVRGQFVSRPRLDLQRFGNDIKIPEMIRLSDMLSIMKEEVTVGLFKQVMQGYKFSGHYAEGLKEILNDPSQTKQAITHVNLSDAREFAKRLSEQTGRKFRVQTEKEWKQAEHELSGNHWTWTETIYEGDDYVLRSRQEPLRGTTPRTFLRFGDTSIRIVEDLA